MRIRGEGFLAASFASVSIKVEAACTAWLQHMRDGPERAVPTCAVVQHSPYLRFVFDRMRVLCVNPHLWACSRQRTFA